MDRKLQTELLAGSRRMQLHMQCQIENMTPRQSMHILFEEQSCQISPWSHWNDGALGFFEEGHHNNKNKMSSDMVSDPDPKINSTRNV